VISDDSGITVPALNNEPGIYSARYASLSATDKENLDKLINELKKQNLHKAKAYYTACIAIAFKGEVYTVHGWMHGDVIDHAIGEGGFGYDPMFIPNGYDKTLGELDKEIKKKISHRSKAMNLALKVIEVFS
jgi:XTP/dITP diphosphohydrolase